MAAHERLQSLKGQENVACSVKYQVLSKETAMVGVVKQKQKATGEMLQYEVKMGKATTPAAPVIDYQSERLESV